jgi:2-oxoglutarate ferredoxin oxidoreductase subunit beta
MRFGKDNTKGLRLRPGKLELEVVTLGEYGVTEADILVHDEHNHTTAFLLANLEPPHFPVALGVLFTSAAPGPSFDHGMHEQNRQARAKGPGDLNALMRKGHTWLVEPEPT